MVEIPLNSDRGVQTQLPIFAARNNDRVSGANNAHDKDRVSGANNAHDKVSLKQQAIQRYLEKAEVKDPVAHVERYSPGGRNTEYYRLAYRRGKKMVRIHIKGGSTISELANYRRDQLQKLIDRGAELAEILAQLTTFNGGSK